MVLKFHLQKIDEFYQKNKKFYEIDELYNEFIELIYPLIKAIFYIKHIFNEDTLQDFYTYVYNYIRSSLSKYDCNKSKFSSYIFLLIKSLLNNFFRSNYYFSYKENSELDCNVLYDSKAFENKIESQETIDKILQSLNDGDKALLLLYYYELIDGEQFNFLRNYLQISIKELLSVLTIFRENNSYIKAREELLLKQIRNSNDNHKKEILLKQLYNINHFGDIEVIKKLTGLSESSIRVKIHRIKKKLKRIVI